MRPRIRRIAALVGTVVALNSCDTGPTESERPAPGTLRAVLVSPNASDAAMLVQLTGTGVSNVVVSGEGRVAFTRSQSDSSVLIAIFGPVSSGEQFRFDVPDVRALKRYTAKVLDVSDSTNALRAALTGYSVQVER